jgi:hypothetical protein
MKLPNTQTTSLLIIYLIAYLPCIATPLQGYISNPPTLCIQHPALDKHGKPLVGSVRRSNIRGLIGCTINLQTGCIAYIFPESDLNKYGVKVGDYVVGIEKELYRPCLLTTVVIYPMDFILDLTIRTSGGVIKRAPVKLIDYRHFTATDS